MNRRTSLIDRIMDAAKMHKSKDGKANVTGISLAVFGSAKTKTRSGVGKILDNKGIPRIKKPHKTSLVEELPEPITVDLSTPHPELEEIEEIDVEFYLALKAKSGSRRAFRLLQQLV